MARMHITDDEQGKDVVTTSGDRIGMVKEVRDGRAYVDPDPGITDAIRSKLGWGQSESGDYELTEDRVESITDHEVKVKETF